MGSVLQHRDQGLLVGVPYDKVDLRHRAEVSGGTFGIASRCYYCRVRIASLRSPSGLSGLSISYVSHGTGIQDVNVSRLVLGCQYITGLDEFPGQDLRVGLIELAPVRFQTHGLLRSPTVDILSRFDAPKIGSMYTSTVLTSHHNEPVSKVKVTDP